MSEKLYKTLFPETDFTKIESFQKLMESKDYKLFVSALSDFKKKKITKVLNMEYELQKIEDLKNLRTYELELKKEMQNVVKPQLCMFITINPKPDVELSTFLTILHKYCNRSMFSRTLYCVEQRGTLKDDNLGTGIHAHVLVCRANGYPPNKIKKNTYNSFKHLVGNEAAIDYGGRYCIIPNRESYITGQKKDPKKHPKQEGDKIWCEKHSIEPYYGKLFSK